MEDAKKERQKCEVWTRVMGYCRPLSQMNIGKKSEFISRQYFTENMASKSVYAEANEIFNSEFACCK